MVAIRRTEEIECPANVWEDGHGDAVLVEEADKPTIFESHLLGGVPRVGVVFLDMVVVHVMTAMGHLPGPVRDKNRAVSEVSKEIVEPFVFGKSAMPAIVTNDLTEQ